MIRRWGFRLAAVVLVPCAALLLLEGALHLFGYGENRSYLVSDTIEGQSVWRDNADFFGIFFPPQLRPVQLPIVVPKQKAPDEIRVLLLGGSAAMGVPDPAFGMAPMLEELLRHRHPDANLRVLNLANTAINSHVVREIASQTSRLDPDVVVVYLGNNEVVGPNGAGTVFTPVAPPKAMVRASIWLQKTRLGQLLRAMVSRGRASGQPSHWQGMEMFLDQQVAADSPQLDRVYDDFRANLNAICEQMRERGVPVVLSTVGTNLRHCAPFASLSLPQVAATLDEAADLRQAGDLAGARSRVESAVDVAPDCADAHYRLGRLCLAMGDTTRGRRELRQARDLDTLRFRADSRIESIVAEVATARASHGVRFVDAADSLDGSSPFGSSGSEYFLEHVHLDLLGNHLVAQSMVPAVEAALSGSGSTGVTLGAAEPRSQLGVMAAAQAMAYTPWTRARLIQQVLAMIVRPPFIGQSDHDEQVARLEDEFGRLRDQVSEMDARSLWPIYERSMQLHPQQWIRRYQAALFLGAGMLADSRAEPLWRELTVSVPHYPAVWNQLADCLIRQGRDYDARAPLEHSLTLETYQPQVLWNLARILRDAGELDAARSRLQELLHRYPEYADAQKMLDEIEGR